jgi:hypothetical protein
MTKPATSFDVTLDTDVLTGTKTKTAWDMAYERLQRNKPFSDRYWSETLMGRMPLDHIDVTPISFDVRESPEERRIYDETFHKLFVNRYFPLVPPGYYWKFKYYSKSHFLRRYKDVSEAYVSDTVGEMELRRKTRFTDRKVADCGVFVKWIRHEGRPLEYEFLSSAGQILNSSFRELPWRDEQDPDVLATYGTSYYRKKYYRSSLEGVQ